MAYTFYIWGKTLRKKKINGLVIFLIGAVVFFYPFISIGIDDYMQNRELEKFLKQEEIQEEKTSLKEEQSKKGTESNRKKTAAEKETYTSSEKENLNNEERFKNKGEKTAVKSEIDGKTGINSSGKKSDEIIGTLYIPKLKQSFNLYEKADMEKISKGVAVTEESDLPMSGIGSRTVIAGHRGYFNKRMFRDVDKLEKGDAIYIKYDGKTIKYEVSDTEVIKDTEKEKLKAIDGREVATLLTCGHVVDGSHRILVNCDRVENNAVYNNETEENNSNIGEKNESGKIIRENKNSKIPEKLEYKKTFIKTVSIIGILLIIYVIVKIRAVIRT